MDERTEGLLLAFSVSLGLWLGFMILGAWLLGPHPHWRRWRDAYRWRCRHDEVHDEN